MDKSANITNVVGKIMRVAREIGAIQKKQMSAGQGGNYGYFAVESVMAAVSDAMDKAGLWIIPGCTDATTSEISAVYHFTYMIVDMESGEYIERPWTQTNASGTWVWNKEAAAMTFKTAKDQTSGMIDSYAYKNFVLKLFGISTPDADTEEAKRIERETKAAQYQETRAQRSITPPQTPKTQPSPIVDAVAPNTVLPTDIELDFEGHPAPVPTAWKATAQFIQTRGYADKVMKLTDEARRAIVADFTKGRTNSMRELSDSDLKDLYDLLTVEYRGLQHSTVWQTKGRTAMAKSASGQRTDNLWHLEGIEIETVLANMHHKIEKSQAKETEVARNAEYNEGYKAYGSFEIIHDHDKKAKSLDWQRGYDEAQREYAAHEALDTMETYGASDNMDM